MAGMTVIVKTISRILFPFIFLFGIYIVVHGHLTPGGGFPGGVIIAAAVAMLILAYGLERVLKSTSFTQAEVLDTLGSLTIAAVGLMGLVFGSYFLQNTLPLGEVGKLISGGNFLWLYVGVGIKVTAGILLILFAMLFATWGEKE
ncbi:MAG: MnhB domain-containing protein [Candidatus Hadarchaeum sp.]|uniref:MnhB domain-containing protein n=1 Tax=Candidatus Hadarchaeum sp. TaxID=2883567 RepID=UPI003D1028C2